MNYLLEVKATVYDEGDFIKEQTREYVIEASTTCIAIAKLFFIKLDFSYKAIKAKTKGTELTYTVLTNRAGEEIDSKSNGYHLWQQDKLKLYYTNLTIKVAKLPRPIWEKLDE